MRNFPRHLKKLVLCGLVVVSSRTQSSEYGVKKESQQALRCEKVLEALQQNKSQLFSSSSLIPLNTLLGSAKCPMIAKNWREAEYNSKSFPTAGQVEMFRTAAVAANEIVRSMKIKAVMPIYDRRDILKGVEATIDLMESKEAPAYIRNAVLMRDGIFMVVPILKRQKIRDPDTKKAFYIPVVAKGHQDLKKFDLLAAAFAAWALEPWQGKMPDKAWVYLVPMVPKRLKNQDFSEGTYTVETREYLHQILSIQENFLNVAFDDEIRQGIQPRRCTHCAICPWAQFCRVKMYASRDLSMMPFPPSIPQSYVLEKLGYGTLDKLEKLKMDSPDFDRVALKAEIKPWKLRYYIAHAIASTRNKPIVLEEYNDPYLDKKYLLHIDFEDLLERGIKSGVYLFGSEIQSKPRFKRKEASGNISETLTHSRPLLKEFTFAKSLTQKGIDEAWARFIKFVKKDKRLQGDNWVMTMYSKHELVKFEQQFDILKQPLEKFSGKERESKFFHEKIIGNKAYGLLIRREEYFSQFRGIQPEDIFNLMDRMIDLLDYTRHKIAFPTHSNSIKNILQYVNTLKESLEYPVGANGLESMAWAKEAYATGESAATEKMQNYNDIDIDANRLVSDFVLSHSGKKEFHAIRMNPDLEQHFKVLEKAVSEKSVAAQAFVRREDLEKLLGSELISLSPKKIAELKSIVDRSEYLATLREYSEDDSYSAEELSAIRQYEKFKYEKERRAQLYDFFTRLNKSLLKNEQSDATEALVDLLDSSSSELTPDHLKTILVLDVLIAHKKKYLKTNKVQHTGSLEIPESYKEFLNELDLPSVIEEAQIDKATVANIWRGLWYL